MNLEPYEIHKEKLRQAFIDNEVGSDEYHEYPSKGLTFLKGAMDILASDLESRTPGVIEDITEKEQFLCLLAGRWLIAMAEAKERWYAGTDQAEAMLILIFNIFWNHRQHPYYDTEEELEEEIKDLES